MEQKKSWYKTNGNQSVIFVPCTPNETLKKAYEHEIRQSKFKIKVVERGGTKLKDILHKKDPFKKTNCGRKDCFICTTGGSGNCSRENISYQIKCTEECRTKDLYSGETFVQCLFERWRTFEEVREQRSEVHAHRTL